MRLDRIVAKLAPNGLRVAVQEPGPEKLADQQPHAAGGMEMINVSLPVRIDPRRAAA